MARRLASVFVAALFAVGLLATAGGAGLSSMVPVLAPTVEFDGLQPTDVPPGMTVVFLPPAGEGFSDGGDGPGGLEWGLGLGFSIHGVLPDGYVAVGALEADDAFWSTGHVPDGLMPVLAEIPPLGFSDGGDLPEGYVPVFFRIVDERGFGS